MNAEPTGIGNGTDQVGRHLQGHLYGGAIGLFDDAVQDLLGPGPSIATTDFRHGNAGLVGGGMLANEFVPTPVSADPTSTRTREPFIDRFCWFIAMTRRRMT